MQYPPLEPQKHTHTHGRSDHRSQNRHQGRSCSAAVFPVMHWLHLLPAGVPGGLHACAEWGQAGYWQQVGQCLRVPHALHLCSSRLAACHAGVGAASGISEHAALPAHCAAAGGCCCHVVSGQQLHAHGRGAHRAPKPTAAAAPAAVALEATCIGAASDKLAAAPYEQQVHKDMISTALEAWRVMANTRGSEPISIEGCEATNRFGVTSAFMHKSIRKQHGSPLQRHEK